MNFCEALNYVSDCKQQLQPSFIINQDFGLFTGLCLHYAALYKQSINVIHIAYSDVEKTKPITLLDNV